MPGAACHHEWCGVVRIARDFARIVSESDQVCGDVVGSHGGGEVEGCARFGGVVGVGEECGVRGEDAGYESQILQVDCAAEARGGVDPWVG